MIWKGSILFYMAFKRNVVYYFKFSKFYFNILRYKKYLSDKMAQEVLQYLNRLWQRVSLLSIEIAKKYEL